MSAFNFTPPPLDLNDVQGDILAGLPKKFEAYWFIQIDDARVTEFRTHLAQLVPLITSTPEGFQDLEKIAHHKRYNTGTGTLLKLSGVNIAFSQKGLAKIGITDKINDAPFEVGMLSDVSNLNDQTSKWLPEFKKDIHSLITITGESEATLDEKLIEVKDIFGDTIHTVKLARGNVRPGKENGHEHFGFLDGVSQPAVFGVDEKPFRGQETVHQGIILLGREGDTVQRPTWALDGSFLTFRYLSQLVPEFQEFVDQNNPVGAPKDFLGARLVGRWKSGAPIDITPLKDNPHLAANNNRNNDFRYDPFSQDRCPFAAHTRKTNPRSDLATTEQQRIIRRGIPFGPEVDPVEEKTQTIHDRGLLFKAYQSNITNGFQFIQKNWADNPKFPFLFTPTVPKPGFDANHGPGFDAIIGQAADGGVRQVDITGGAQDGLGNLTLKTEWVISKGGEYFFSPSIPTLKNTFALPKTSAPGADL